MILAFVKWVPWYKITSTFTKPVVSTMPSRMTTISNCSFLRERCDRSKNGLLVLISWQMVKGDTRKSWSAPVPKPTSNSHWSKGRNSPSGVCRDWKQTKKNTHYNTSSWHFDFCCTSLVINREAEGNSSLSFASWKNV